MAIQLYRLMPLIIRWRDKLAEGAGYDDSVEGVLEKIMYAAEQESDVTDAEIDALKTLIDPDSCNSKYLLYMSLFLGIPIGSEYSDTFRRWFVKNIGYFHKIKGTHLAWKKQSRHILSGRWYFAWELYKSTIYEVGNYSRFVNYGLGLRAARFDFRQGFEGPFLTPEVANLGDGLVANFERVRPIHVLLRKEVVYGEGEVSLPRPVEEWASDAYADLEDELVMEDEFEYVVTCISSCQSGCTGFAEAACSLSCTANAEGGCSHQCEQSSQVPNPEGGLVNQTAGGDLAVSIIQNEIPGISEAAKEIETFLAYVTKIFGDPSNPNWNQRHYLNLSICYPLESWVSTGATLTSSFLTSAAGCELSCQTSTQGGSLPDWTDTLVVPVVDRGIRSYYWATGPDSESGRGILDDGSYEGDTLLPALHATIGSVIVPPDPNVRGDYVVVRYFRPFTESTYDHPTAADINGTNKRFTGALPNWPVPMSVRVVEIASNGNIRQIAQADAYGIFRGNVDTTATNTVWNEQATSRPPPVGPFSYDVTFKVPPLIGSTVRVFYKAGVSNCTLFWIIDVLHRMWGRYR